MVTKVAYNACYGGFSLSDKAVKLARELSGNPEWGGCVLPGEKYKSGQRSELTSNMNHVDCNLPRHDPILVSVIEKLGEEEASGECARLCIAEVYGSYRIDEYDGRETIETPDTIDWINP